MSVNHKIIPRFYEYPLIFFKFFILFFKFGRNGFFSIIINLNLLTSKQSTFFKFFRVILEKKSTNFDFITDLAKLGPGFVKLGQALSTRPDIFGTLITNKLIFLQDDLEPFSSEIAIDIIEKEFKARLDTIFSYFDKNPLAAASVAQVHKGVLKNGKKVAIKILRPEIENKLFADFKFFYGLCSFLEQASSRCRKLKLKEIVKTFAESSLNEVDLRLEASQGEQLKENFINDEYFSIPKIYWEFTSKRTLVTEFVNGVRIDQINQLKNKIDISNTTKKASQIFFNQVFRDGFFHADLHPGNIFINNKGIITAVDFGIMGRLTFEDRKFLSKLFNLLLNKRFYDVALLHQENNMLGKNTDLNELALQIRILTIPILDKPIGEISMGNLFGEILSLSHKFDIKIQTKFCLLQKAMVMAEGTARQINPKANMWKLMEPLMEQWVKKNYLISETFIEFFNKNSSFIKNFNEFIQKLESLLKKFHNKSF